jgi:hypothetical protein
VPPLACNASEYAVPVVAAGRDVEVIDSVAGAAESVETAGATARFNIAICTEAESFPETPGEKVPPALDARPIAPEDGGSENVSVAEDIEAVTPPLPGDAVEYNPLIVAAESDEKTPNAIASTAVIFFARPTKIPRQAMRPVSA